MFWVLMAFLAALCVQLLFWIGLFLRLLLRLRQVDETADKQTAATFPVSVIICGYNEGHNFKQFLPLILQQDYPDFEVIVVNDRSTDDSEAVLTAFEQEYPHLRVLHLKDFERTQRGKKFALTQGIKAAQHEVVLLTDADCYPNSNRWVRTMAAALTADKVIGIAYVPFDKRPTFLNRFLRYDKITIAIQYLSFALAGLPYMGAGANLIYRKSLFLNSDGFQKHQHIASGDDDLFVSAVANRKNMAVVLHPDSFIYCEPMESVRGFYRQKTRHLSTSWHYRRVHQILLGALAQSHFWLYIFAAISCANPTFREVVLLGLLLRWLVMWSVFSGIARRFKEADLTPFLPLWDVLYLVYYVAFALPLVRGNGGKW